MERKIVCIYRATNRMNLKIYIGRTVDFNRRLREHRRHAPKDGGDFHKDILKFGFDSFSWEILQECDESQLDDLEKWYIALYREKFGIERVYNQCKGGIGGQTHDVSGANNPMFGRAKTDEERQHLHDMLSGRPKPPGFGERVSRALTGKKKSPEHVAKKSDPISVVDIVTGSILSFPSKSEMQRVLHCDTSTILNGGISHNRYKFHSCGKQKV